MRIVHVTPTFAPAWGYGGPPKVAQEMAYALGERGHEVDVHTSDALDATSRFAGKDEPPRGVRVHRHRNVSNRLAWEMKVFASPRFRRALKESVRRADVVHALDFRTHMNGVAFRYARRHGKPFVLSPFGATPHSEDARGLLKRAYDARYGDAMLRESALVTAQTASEARSIEAHGTPPGRVRFLPLAFDTRPFDALPPRGAFRAKHGVPESAPMVLFLGRIHRTKGLQTLLPAFARARKAAPDARLVLVGRDDGALDEVRRLLSELRLDGAALFAGPAYGDEKLRAYADADLFAITPLHEEGTSLAALEACASGVPALVSDRADIPWLLERDAGWSVPYDLDAVAGALVEALADPAGLARKGKNAAALMRERYDWRAVVRDLEAMYEETLRRPAA